MTRSEAASLAGFINRRDARYHAETLHLGDNEAWVLLSDRQERVTPRPVIDVPGYLEDGRTDGDLSAGCRDLLTGWLGGQAERMRNVIAFGQPK